MIVAKLIRANNASTLSEKQRAAGYRAVAASPQERKLQRQKARSLPLLAAPPVASLMGTLKSLEEHERQKGCAPGKKGHGPEPRSAHTSPGFLSGFHLFPWVQEGEGFLLHNPISFLAFPGLIHVPSPWTISFSPNFLRLVPFPFDSGCLSTYCKCLIVLLPHLASTMHALSKRNPLSSFSSSLP